MKLIKNTKILFITLFLSCLNGTHATELGSLEFLTESYPPYNFKDGGKLQGIAVDLLTQASQSAGDPITSSKIKLLPWPRAYSKATEGPNIVLFSTTRTEQREPLFHWVGPISATRVVLMARKSDKIVINSEADIKKYIIGAIRDDIGEVLVKAAGVPDSSIKKIPRANSLVKMLNSGRINLWAYEENVSRWFIKQEGLKNSDFEAVHVLKESDLYYTFSKDINKEVVDKLQQGVDAIRGDKRRYQDIVNKYL